MVKTNTMVGCDKKSRMWQARVKAWRRSGLSQREYCRRNHLSSSQFSYWKKSLEPKVVQEPSAFVPVPLTMTPKMHKVNGSGSGLTVRLANGIGIELSDEFNSATLAQAVVALGGRL